MFSLSDETLYRLRWFARGRCASARDRSPFAGRCAGRAPCAAASADEVAAAAAHVGGAVGAGRPRGRLDAAAHRPRSHRLRGDTGARRDARRPGRTARAAAAGRAPTSPSSCSWPAIAAARTSRSSCSRFRTCAHGKCARARPCPTRPDAGAVQLMSVHAAKGLEFPVVVVADLGRGPRGGNAPRILHDPMFGLACQVRDENGDWVKPASYRWAEWLDERMEQRGEQAAALRRLHPCGRSPDPVGPASCQGQLVGRTGLSVGARSRRRRASAMHRTGPGIASGSPGRRVRKRKLRAPGRISVRAACRRSRPSARSHRSRVLSRRSPHGGPSRSRISMTRTIRTACPKVRPVLRSGAGGRPAGGPRHFLVGNLAHRALADWECLDLPPRGSWRACLIRWARRGGLIEPADVARAVGRVTQNAGRPAAHDVLRRDLRRLRAPRRSSAQHPCRRAGAARHPRSALPGCAGCVAAARLEDRTGAPRARRCRPRPGPI